VIFPCWLLRNHLNQDVLRVLQAFVHRRIFKFKIRAERLFLYLLFAGYEGDKPVSGKEDELAHILEKNMDDF
jgi:hypothetical protein